MLFFEKNGKNWGGNTIFKKMQRKSFFYVFFLMFFLLNNKENGKKGKKVKKVLFKKHQKNTKKPLISIWYSGIFSTGLSAISHE